MPGLQWYPDKRLLIALSLAALSCRETERVSSAARDHATSVDEGARPGSVAQPDDPIIQKYRRLIPELMAEQDIPGLAVAVVDNAHVLWAEGFGFTDTDRRVAITPRTIFSIQSTSKTVTATAIMMAVQQGLLDLDAPITTYVPDFTVNSLFEEHPERKITLRHLLSHTAGFTHEAPVGNNADLGAVRFQDHIASISDTWLRFPVGTGFAYSNLGIDLAGNILQVLSGRPFWQYVEENLFHPLGMVNSSFDVEVIRPDTRRAIGHTGSFPRVPIEIPIIPSGGLYTSADEMGRFIQFHLNRGVIKGRALLEPRVLDEMYTVIFPVRGQPDGYALGVGRWRNADLNDALAFNHPGGAYGFVSYMRWYPELGIGISVLINSANANLSIAQDILNDFIAVPGTVYHDRLAALAPKSRAVRGEPIPAPSGGNWLPPADLAQTIARLAPQSTAQHRARWAEYVGMYRTRVWNLLDLISTPSRVFERVSTGRLISPPIWKLIFPPPG